MNDVTKLTPHETLELHELLNASVISAKKLNKSVNMVKDTELKDFMKTTLNAKKSNINDLHAIVTKIKDNGGI